MTIDIQADLRPELGAVRNQGRRPTCLAFAASAVHRHTHRHGEELCVEWLYYHAVKRAGDGPDEGSTVDDTRAVLSQEGQPDEPFWPYRDVSPNGASWRPPGEAENVLRCGSAVCNPDLAHIRSEIEAARPTVLALLVSDVFLGGWEEIEGEVLLRDDTEPIDRARGHAVVAVGYGLIRGEPCFLVRNSWGERWGRNGYAWIRESYIGRRLLGAFVVKQGVDDVLQSETAETHGRTRLA